MEAIKFYMEYDEGNITLVGKLKEYLEKYEVYKPEGITIGYWEDAYENTPIDVINYIVENKIKFPNLKRMFLGDMDGEECEVSWINHEDSSSLLNDLKLEELVIKGATGLRLQNVKSDSLKSLTIISGGMSTDLLKDISEAKIPNLEHLELYLGVEDYGFNGDISTLEPFMKRSNFPKLKYLGLKNSEIEDDICEKILKLDILEILEVLDMSLGTLSDKSAELILDNLNNFSHLKKLDLTYNYISDNLVQDLEKAFSDLNVELLIGKDDVYVDEDDDYRYPYITE